MSPDNSPVPPKYLQQEVLSPECEDLISSLPKEKGWFTSYLYKYQGFWANARHLQAIIACQNHFQAKSSDILLATPPKSGTTWLKALVFTLMNRARYPVTQNDHPLISNNPHDLVPFFDIHLYADNKIPDLSSFPSPRLFSTHLPYSSLPKSVQDCEGKIVYLCRNPKDTFVSSWHFTNRLRDKDMGFNSLEDALSMFCSGLSSYGPMWDHVLSYWNESKKNPSKILFVRYEDLKAEPVAQLRQMAEFLGCPFSIEEEMGVVEEILKLGSFDNLRNLEINKVGEVADGVENKLFFRQGEVGDWKNFLSEEMARKIDQITEQKFIGSGLIL